MVRVAFVPDAFERVKTFVPGMDKLIQGGFPKGHVILVAGTPGVGKSILCSQILYFNAMEGKKCLYLNLEQNSSRIESQMIQFGWDPKKAKNLKLLSLDADDPNLVNFLLLELKNSQYDVVCLDSLDSITSNPVSPSNLSFKEESKVFAMDPLNMNRLRLKSIFKALGQSNSTILLTSERVESPGNQGGLTRDTISEFLCDGILLLRIGSVGTAVRRTLAILKMRLTKIDLFAHPFEITETGIRLE
ncbi:MAG: AAA family ATPase [Candidatus Diapherotrites archaeon]|uniref:AAA family ATPase n=1 Tax=Candidatus Iainarchaeum sp. TaxID=3101447 RepID=A0A8T4L576_9ARCH|nr:AAA family ATPase [Candidatus Diapherotrites archaeon]